MDIVAAVGERYSAASREAQPGLCCPVDVDPKYLEVIPGDVLERDYGCGDPVSHVRPGETVVDLGSGGGKVCFIAAQIVGPRGHVIGVDVNDDMLALARGAQRIVTERLGYSNLTFVKATIEDLGIDLEFLDAHLNRHPVANAADLSSLHAHLAQLRTGSPAIADDTADVVISNCVLNLVDPDEKGQMFREVFRVLRPGGRAVISDIVADQDVPPELQADPHLWSGCYTGALREDRFVDAFVDAGMHGVTLLKRDDSAWHEVRGIEFRSVTVVAYKAVAAPTETSSPGFAALYNGPFARTVTDAGTVLVRGSTTPITPDEAMALSGEPYTGHLQLLRVAARSDPARPALATSDASAGESAPAGPAVKYRLAAHPSTSCTAPGCCG